MNATPCVPEERRPILTVKTLKNWVLPPRPKNARRARVDKKPKDKEKKCDKTMPAKLPVAAGAGAGACAGACAAAPQSSTPQPSLSPTHSTQSTPSMQPTSQPNQPITQSSCKPASTLPSKTPSPDTASGGTSLAAALASSIGVLDKENYQLKIKLLSLIHDYKRLKSHLMLSPMDPALPALVDADSPASTSRKRVFTEVNDPMNELILNMNHLSHRSPSDLQMPEEPFQQEQQKQKQQELEADDKQKRETSTTADSPADVSADVFNYINLDSDLENEDDEFDLTLLSRLVSPGCSETDGEGLLMTSITRSTTVSTNNLSLVHDKKPGNMFKFYDLPAYLDSEYGFTFESIDPHDKMLSVIEEDHYNQVADFLEEKLLSNDVEYYVKKEGA